MLERKQATRGRPADVIMLLKTVRNGVRTGVEREPASSRASRRAPANLLAVATAVTLAGAAPLGSGCPGETVTCESSADCGEGKVCWQGTCSQACNVNIDCSAGDACSNGVCVPVLDSGSGRDRAAASDGAGDHASVDAASLDAIWSDGAPRDSAVPDASTSDVLHVDASSPDLLRPDSLLPDSLLPDTRLPDTSLPDSCIPELCDGLDNDCDGIDDNGCDDDADLYCDDTMSVIGSPAVCPLSPPDTGDDCDDGNVDISPDGSEGPGRHVSCSDGDDNDCDGDTDLADADCQSDPTWWDVDWQRRRKLTFLNSARQQDLLEFPVLVHLNLLTFPVGVFDSDGADIRFVDADDATPLAHEIERWDEYSADVWVKVPQIDSGSDTDFIWLYHHNPAASDGQNPSEVWSDGFAAVWHMNQDPSSGPGAIRDSTAHGHHGTAVGMEVGDLQTGAVGLALDFGNSCEHVRVPSVAGDSLELGASAYTIEAWVQRRGEIGDYMHIIGRQYGSGWDDSYSLAARQADPTELGLYSYPYTCRGSGGTLDLDSWVYVAGHRIGDTARTFKNGTRVDLNSAWNDQTTYDDNDVTIGGQENGSDSTVTECWYGLIDEVRLSSVIRNSGWLQAQHDSMTGSFLSLGSAEVF